MKKPVPKKKPATEEVDKLRKRDAMALAELIYDIYTEKKAKEQKDKL